MTALGNESQEKMAKWSFASSNSGIKLRVELRLSKWMRNIVDDKSYVNAI